MYYSTVESTLLFFFPPDYSSHTKTKPTTRGPPLIYPPTPKTSIILPDDRGTKTGNTNINIIGTGRPGKIDINRNGAQIHRPGNDDSVEKRTGSRAVKCSGTFVTICMFNALHA